MGILKNDQHKVFLFNEGKEATMQTSRAGHVYLEFNMNAHVRSHKRIFLIQTEPGQAATAKQLVFEENGAE